MTPNELFAMQQYSMGYAPLASFQAPQMRTGLEGLPFARARSHTCFSAASRTCGREKTSPKCSSAKD